MTDDLFMWLTYDFEQVLTELGYDADQISELRKEGIV
jgi:crotonobetainyl-CoA:carnitine CoA-transferase CaiB-like acyl-CoA transferase